VITATGTGFGTDASKVAVLVDNKAQAILTVTDTEIVAVLNNVNTNSDTTVEVITPDGFSTNDATLIFLEQKDLNAAIVSLNLSTGSSGGLNVAASVLATGSAENHSLVDETGADACIEGSVVYSAATDVTSNVSFPTLSCTLKQRVYSASGKLRITLGGVVQGSSSY
jgi:hypothetical protein